MIHFYCFGIEGKQAFVNLDEKQAEVAKVLKIIVYP